VTGRGDDHAADVAGHLGGLFGYFLSEIGLCADRQDRAADRVGVMREVLFGGEAPRFVIGAGRWPTSTIGVEVPPGTTEPALPPVSLVSQLSQMASIWRSDGRAAGAPTAGPTARYRGAVCG